MFKKINEGKVENENGISIHIVGLERLKYVEKNFSKEFEWNYDPTTRKTYVYISDDNELNESDKKRIISNIREALKLLTGNFEIRE